MKAINLFVAYAPEDKEYRDKLGSHLSTLKEKGFLNEYCISEVLAGSDSDLEIRTMINKAQIILLLISSDFLASEDCRRLEDLAFSMKMRNDAVVVPVLLRSCMYDESYNQLQILPDNKKPISDKTAWADEDAALTNVAERIKQLVIKIRAEDPQALANTAHTTSTTGTVISNEANSTTSTATSAIPWKVISGVLALGLLVSFFFFRPSKTTPAQERVEKNPVETDIGVTEKDPKVTPGLSTPTTPPKEVTFETPDLVNLSWGQAVARLKQAGIEKYRRKDSGNCKEKPELVLGQKPKAGEMIKEGEEVVVLVNKTPRRIAASPISGGGKLRTLTNGGRYTQNAWAIKNTNVEFSLEGTECSLGSVTIDHPLGGTTKHTLKAGQLKSNSRFFGVGTIKIYFSTQDPRARLKLKVW